MSNPFDQVQGTWFQLLPYREGSCSGRCMFHHIMMDIDNVFHVSDVSTVTVGYYNFFVTLLDPSGSGATKVQEFIFERRLDVVKAHREFARAYTNTEVSSSEGTKEDSFTEESFEEAPIG